MSRMPDNTEQLESIEGELQSPNVHTKIFNSTKQLAEFLLWSNPLELRVDTGRGNKGNMVYQLQYKN
jgi:hypothetical protein